MSDTEAEASTPLKYGKNEGGRKSYFHLHIFMKAGGRKIKGKRKIKLLKHIIA